MDSFDTVIGGFGWVLGGGSTEDLGGGADSILISESTIARMLLLVAYLCLLKDVLHIFVSIEQVK